MALHSTRVPRKYGRKTIYQRVHWDHRSGERLSGSLRDISAGGAFLTPAAHVLAQVRTGDVIWIELESREGARALSAIVRWCGFSPRHGCCGFGAEFEERTRQDAVALLPQLQ